jgi:hypothetical protein
VVQAEAERDRARCGRAGVRAGERFSVVVVSFHEQKLEACPAEQSTSRPEEAAPLRVARQVAKVAEGDERVAVLLDCALDQVGQVASVAVQVAENEQPAHEPSLTLARPETGDLAAVVRWCSARQRLVPAMIRGSARTRDLRRDRPAITGWASARSLR